jgi:opacity protein-like surface antigen
LIGKLGISANSVKLTDTLGGSDKQNNTNLSFGLGASYKFTPNIAVRAEYEDFGKFIRGNANGGDVRGNNFSVSLLYSF